jgi:DNA-directed RNA polymerase specialized sigma24 family protein
MTEQELIQRCLRNERAAQKLLYERYAPKLYNVCRHYTRHDFESNRRRRCGSTHATRC